MILSYTTILETLLSGDIGKYVPEGIAHSFPIISRDNGRIVDCFFLFSYSRNSEEFNSPIARLAIDSIAKKLVYYQDDATMPFEPDNELHSYPLEFKHSKDERREALFKYQESYILVRKFAFIERIDTEKYNILSSYMKAFNVLVATHQKPFYVALSPEFFEWMTSTLKSKPQRQ